jgi:large subunit ribosomal protein L18
MREQAALVGNSIAEVAKTKKIAKVVFDRGGFLYAGVIRAIADAARSAGLEF